MAASQNNANQNNYSNLKKPLYGSIPAYDNTIGTQNFRKALSDRLKKIKNNMTPNDDYQAFTSTLTFSDPATAFFNSHTDDHMPLNNFANSSKTNSQINALDKMLTDGKNTHCCFTSKDKGHKLIMDGLIAKSDEIADWLQEFDEDTNIHKYQDPSKIKREFIISSKELNNILYDGQDEYKNIGYGFSKTADGRINAVKTDTMTIVLHINKQDNTTFGQNGLGFYVQTAYPGSRQRDIATKSTNNMLNLTPIHKENVVDIVKQTPYYNSKKLSEIAKAALLVQADPTIPLAKNGSLSHNNNAAIICGPITLSQSKNNYKQNRYFVKQDKNKNLYVESDTFMKDAHDSQATWTSCGNDPKTSYAKPIQYVENMKKAFQKKITTEIRNNAAGSNVTTMTPINGTKFIQYGNSLNAANNQNTNPVPPQPQNSGISP